MRFKKCWYLDILLDYLIALIAFNSAPVEAYLSVGCGSRIFKWKSSVKEYSTIAADSTICKEPKPLSWRQSLDELSNGLRKSLV